MMQMSISPSSVKKTFKIQYSTAPNFDAESIKITAKKLNKCFHVEMETFTKAFTHLN